VSLPDTSPLYPLLHQPDFGADAELITPNQAMLAAKITKKAGALHAEFPFPKIFPLKVPEGTTFIIHLEPGKAPLVLMPQQKLYSESPQFLGFSPGAMLQVLFGSVASQASLKTEDAGTETIDGHECSKLKVVDPAKPTETNLTMWMAKDLQNLVIRVDGMFQGQIYKVNLKNVTMTPSDEALALPKDYEKTFTKVDVEKLLSPPTASTAQGSAPAPSAPTAPAPTTPETKP